tara:strand:+ start:370 stop:597 length:228 start_codon:yes stop_codon:yes gene_type:complete
MKLLFENWRKLLEGEVIDFPVQVSVSEDDMQEVIKLENDVAELLADIFGNQAEIPIDVMERMEDLINEVEEALKK